MQHLAAIRSSAMAGFPSRIGPIMPDVGSWTQPRQQAISLADE